MRKFIAICIAWAAVCVLALASMLTALAEAIHKPRRDDPPGPQPGA